MAAANEWFDDIGEEDREEGSDLDDIYSGDLEDIEVEDEGVFKWTELKSRQINTVEIDIDEFTGAKPGTCNIDNGASPIDIFYTLCGCDLSFNGTNLIALLVEETNRYAHQYFEKKTEPLSDRKSTWYDTNHKEMCCWIGLTLAMGVLQKPDISSYWWTGQEDSWLFTTPHFGSVMSRNRYQLILTFLHVSNNMTNDPKDPISKIRPVVDLVNSTFKTYYNLSRDICIDEDLIGFKGRSKLKQYLPAKKSNKFGIKIWCLADSHTFYLHQIRVYEGKGHDTHKHGLGFNVVAKLMEDHLDKGYHVTTDSFFTSPKLTEYLLERGTYSTGTVRATIKGLPATKNKLTKKGEMAVWFSKAMIFLQYKDNKLFHMLSNYSRPSLINKADKDIPEVVSSYTETMAGVDKHAQLVHTYEVTKRCNKMWQKVLFNILGRICVNAYTIIRRYLIRR